MSDVNSEAPVNSEVPVNSQVDNHLCDTQEVLKVDKRNRTRHDINQLKTTLNLCNREEREWKINVTITN